MNSRDEIKHSIDDHSADDHGIAFADAVRVWMVVGWLSFGGPAGQIAMLHRIVVEERKWISESRFLHALNYCMLLPGPEAQQLAIYLGWLLHRIRGGIVAGTLFVLPGALVILAISILYVRYQDLIVVDAIFSGVKAAVLAVVLAAVLRIGKKILSSQFGLAIAVGAFVGIFFFAIPFPLIVIAAGIIGIVIHNIAPQHPQSPDTNNADPNQTAAHNEYAIDRAIDRSATPPSPVASFARNLRVPLICLALWLGPVIALGAVLGADNVYAQQGVFFSQMAVVTFGGAYAVLAYMAQQAVTAYGWLNAGEMLDGLGMAESTPGPLIMVVQFVGFLAAYRSPGALDPLLAGTLGAMLATWVTFVPCFLWIFLGAPYIEKLRDNQIIKAALEAITAAVVGVIANLSLWFAMHVLFAQLHDIRVAGMAFQSPVWSSVNPSSALLAIAAFILLPRLGMIKTLGVCMLSSIVVVYSGLGG